MEEAQALLLKNFLVGKGNQSACAQWLTEMARDPLAPIPFGEVFVILALFLPQLTFVDEATTRQEWSSPTVRKFGPVVVRIYSTEERRLHTTCLETAKKAMESFGLFE